ncbi:MAG: type II toxin-antitoxin system RelE/ParE family toxin [Spirochaetaceae bacterium]|nr:type II toxin-antitoxin system RelE/ParE family toxin [Spirochaetaceae bacterium]
MKVIWTEESLEKLSAIEEFIGTDSPERAKTFVDYLIMKGKSISENPKIGRIVPEISNPYIRELIVKKYRIVYKYSEKKVAILTVFEGHRLLRIDELEMEMD